METTKTIMENADRFEIGTAGKGGAIKVSGDFNDMETFKKRIDNAVELRKYAQSKMEPVAEEPKRFQI